LEKSEMFEKKVKKFEIFENCEKSEICAKFEIFEEKV
jgi:hypothetical protein